MNKIGIVVDSTAYLNQEQILRYQIELVPINVMFEGKVYRDAIDLTPSRAYQFLEKNPKDWATSAPSVGDFLTAFKKLANQGAKEIICLTLPTAISATFNNARMAMEFAKTELPDVKIEVIDTGTATVGETLLVLAVARAIEAGKSFQEVVELAENLKSKVRVFLLLETIRYIYRSGRVPEVASKIGAILPLKPILSVHGGKLHFFSATTSMGKSEEKILKLLKDTWDENLPEIGLMYIESQQEVEKFKEEISSLLPKAQIFISEFSPVLGYAAGRGTLGIGFFAKD
jgi:DegV family protein with EDD domain